jgi:hypothetical protein
MKLIHSITDKRPFPSRKPPDTAVSQALVNIDWGTEPIDVELDAYPKLVKNKINMSKRVL